MIIVEPVVNEEKARALLGEACESDQLDYKETIDLRETRDVIELTKDVGAMGALGGYVVIGADDGGKLTGRFTEAVADLFDEATLRQALEKRLPRPVSVLAGRSVVDGLPVVVIYVAPRPDGLTVFAKDGQYQEQSSSGGRTRTVFKAGEVFVRHGSSSERWQQDDIARILARRDERVREETRAELASVLAAVQRGQRGIDIAGGPPQAFTWQLDEATFDSTATALLRSKDDASLRLFLVSAAGEAARLLEHGDTDGVRTLLDRLVSLAAVALTLGRGKAFARTVRALLAVYQLGHTVRGGAGRSPVPNTVLWAETVGRVEALGGLAVRLEDWAAVRRLAIQEPGDANYVTWLRHGQVHASRDRLFPMPNGYENAGVLVAVARRHTHRLPALRPDWPDDSAHDEDPTVPPAPGDPLLDSICGFDALAGFAAVATGKGRGGGVFYASFAGYYAHRVESVLVKLVTDTGMLAELAPNADSDTARESLRALLEGAERVSEGRGRIWDLYNDRINAFLGQATA